MRNPLAAMAALALTAAVGCVDIVAIDGPRYTQTDERRFAVSGRPDVTVTTFDGRIEVRPWDRPEVLVVVEKRGIDRAAVESIEVQAEQTGDRIRVSAALPSGNRGTGFSFDALTARGATMIVSLPASADLRARSADGSIIVERISGRVELHSGDGRIDGRALSGEVRAETGDGSIHIDGMDGSLAATTGDGSIVARGRFANVQARTGDGSIRLQAESGSRAADDWDVTTGDGSLYLELPESFGAQLDAHTGDGRIHVKDVALSNVTGRIRRDRVRGQLGAGGRALRLRTGDGTITVQRY